MSLLVLAGTAEARKVCTACAHLPLTASLAGTHRKLADLGVVPVRVGGFGGEAGFAAYLGSHRVSAVLDATHPFAQVGHRTARICARMGVACLRLTRPHWREGPGDTWQTVASLAGARRALPISGTTLLTTGAGSVTIFAGVRGVTLWLRTINRPAIPAPWEKGGFIVAPPGTTPAHERHLFERYAITCLVTKNAGGMRGQAKLSAARALGLPVIMIERPTPPDAPTTQSVQYAIDWLHAHAPSA